MTPAAQRAVDSLAARVLDETVVYDEERADVLDAVALKLRARASQLRAEKIERSI